MHVHVLTSFYKLLYDTWINKVIIIIIIINNNNNDFNTVLICTLGSSLPVISKNYLYNY